MSSTQLKPQPQAKTYRLTIKDRQGNTSHIDIEAASVIEAKEIAASRDNKLCFEYVILENVGYFERQVCIS